MNALVMKRSRILLGLLWHPSADAHIRSAKMQRSWTLLVLLWWLSATLPLQAQIIENYTFSTFSGNPSLDIPDGNPAGVSDHRPVNSLITDITSLAVGLDITGEFNGDLYVYLRYGSAFSVLLNRPGR